jgi:ribosome-associated toxin RatA of RatAB toxin-antitoxin module
MAFGWRNLTHQPTEHSSSGVFTDFVAGFASGLATLTTGIALVLVTAVGEPAIAQQRDALASLPSQEQSTLRSGQATISGSDGQFVGRVLVNAPATSAWQVLTDYDNFERFFPYVEASQLLESSGNRRVFEQINLVQIFPVSNRSRVVIAATESYPQAINFQMVEGDMDSLRGVWRVEPVAITGGQPHQVLITHQVSLDPEGGWAARELVFSMYRMVLADTLVAIRQEAERRAGR